MLPTWNVAKRNERPKLSKITSLHIPHDPENSEPKDQNLRDPENFKSTNWKFAESSPKH